MEITPSKNRYLDYWLPVLIMVLAVGLRLYQLDRIPAGLWYDEAIHGLDTLQINEQHHYPIFFNTDNHPQEPMYSYLIALFYGIFGIAPLTLRLTSVAIGCLTILLVYYGVRKWFDRRIALFTMFFLAISKWHLMFSRLALRTILTPLFALLVFHFLYRALKEFKLRDYILSGVFLGLGLYTYISFRIVPVLVFLLILHEIYHSTKEDRWKKSFVQGGCVLFGTALIVFLPLLIDYIQYPFHFFGRTEEISIFQNGLVEGIRFILSNTIKTLGMFSFIGDPEIKHNNPSEPMLPLILSLFLLLGLVVSFRRIKELRMAIIIGWFGFFLIPGILSQGAPNTLRTLGGAPALCIFIALGITTGYDYLLERLGTTKKWILVSAVAAILLYSTVLVSWQYFVRWGSNPMTALHFNINEYQLGEMIHGEGTQIDYYLPPVLADQRVIQFVSHPVAYYSYNELKDIPAPERISKPLEIISLNPHRFSGVNGDILKQILQDYPDSRILGNEDEINQSWIIRIYIPKRNP